MEIENPTLYSCDGGRPISAQVAVIYSQKRTARAGWRSSRPPYTRQLESIRRGGM